ncbi:MAG: hypothetical protein IPI93_03855 [Sphingobacteriaceae bacterium]|nr:hypothetical protein [Sphingobacteriaceae bacterium]
MKKNKYILLFAIISNVFFAQINTFSPYSRFGLGELNQTTFSHNQAMAGTCIAFKPDSLYPVMINTGNPASYALIKFATFEVGGNFVRSSFTTSLSSVYKWTTNFNYGSLGFPIRRKSGAAFGIMPYSNVGYNMQSVNNEPNIGNVTYNYNGEGGFNKVFLGYGTMPFKERLMKFRKKQVNKELDSAYNISRGSYKFKELMSEIASDFSIGANANYLFGSTLNYTDVRYPNSLTYFNTIREKTVRINDFTGNFGIQTAFTIDSVKAKKDTGNVVAGRLKRGLSEKVKITFGYYMALNNTVKAKYDLVSYNYFLNNTAIVPKDTVLKAIDQSGKITLPLEQGFGIGFKKGEKFNLVVDYAITDWSKFKMFEYANTLKNNMRTSIGFNYVPDKYVLGKGTYFKRTQYRAGAFYNSGYLDINKTLIKTYGVSAGLSLPVGIRTGTGLVNIGVQYGVTGTQNNGLIKENFLRVNFGFTFNSTYLEDLWFRKFKYD